MPHLVKKIFIMDCTSANTNGISMFTNLPVCLPIILYRFSIEQLTTDINNLEERVNAIEGQLEQLEDNDEDSSIVKQYVQTIIKVSLTTLVPGH